MKKVLSFMLTLILVLSMSTAAFAADGDAATETLSSKAAAYEAVIKAYNVNGKDGETDVYPEETLSFTSVADTANPDTTNLTIDQLVVNGSTNQTLKINVPAYTKVGTYHYTISETAGTTQGVTYTTDKINVSVLVTYDYDDADSDGCKLTATVGITSADDAKKDTFTNTYDLGSLAVSKKVTGNLGDKNKEFNVKVTFTAENGKKVNSAITCNDMVTEVNADGEKSTTSTKTIASGWSGTKSVYITLKDDKTVTFTNIPAGITYTVVEDDYTTGDKNGENGYDKPEYSYSDDEKKISAKDSDTVSITNNKGVKVDTGISLDSIPYIMMLMMAFAGIAFFAMKKRQSYED